MSRLTIYFKHFGKLLNGIKSTNPIGFESNLATSRQVLKSGSKGVPFQIPLKANSQINNFFLFNQLSICSLMPLQFVSLLVPLLVSRLVSM